MPSEEATKARLSGVAADTAKRDAREADVLTEGEEKAGKGVNDVDDVNYVNYVNYVNDVNDVNYVNDDSNEGGRMTK